MRTPILLLVAVLLQAMRLTEEAAPRTGLPGLRALAEELPSWKQQPDADRCFRLAAQVIEQRGTGGGLFRRMYAQFLEEASFPELARCDLVRGRARGERRADAEEALWKRALDVVDA